MTVLRIILTIQFLTTLVCSEMINIDADKELNNSTREIRLMFILNNELMYVDCDPENECTKIQTFMGRKDVRDFTWDEVMSRVYWISNNGNHYIYDFNTSTNRILPSCGGGNISLDLLTNKLNVEFSTIKPICIGDFYAKIVDNWINPFVERISIVREKKFIRMIQDFHSNKIFAMTEEENEKHIYQIGMKMPIAVNVTSEDFDADHNSKMIFWVNNTAIVGVDYEGKNRVYIDTGSHLMPFLSIDDYQRIWIMFKNESSGEISIGWCKYKGSCKRLTTYELKESQPRRLRVRRTVFEKPEPREKCEKVDGCLTDCLISPCWPYQCPDCKDLCKENDNSQKQRNKRQIPFDMYSQQPTLRPETLPTQPDVSYLPFYLYPGK